MLINNLNFKYGSNDHKTQPAPRPAAHPGAEAAEYGGQLRRHQRGSPGTGSGLDPGRQLHRLGRLGEHRRHRPEGRGAAG